MVSFTSNLFLTGQQRPKLQPQLVCRAALNAESSGCPEAVWCLRPAASGGSVGA